MDKAFWCEDRIVADTHFMQEIETSGIQAIAFYQGFWVDDIPLRLGHLTFLHEVPAMGENLLGQWQAQGHENSWPVNHVETGNILTDDMGICWPVLVVAASIIRTVT